MSLDILRRQIHMAAYVTAKNTDGITHDESLVRLLGDDGSNINWTVGHVVFVRCQLLRHLGQPSVWTPEEWRPYARGSAPSPELMPFDEVRRAFDLSQERFLAGLGTLTEERMATMVPGPNGEESLGSLVGTIIGHDLYHLGQLGVLRRVVGKEGVIK
ncbi:MAG TPA: DinB family protein [Thermoanaerobaculia bacterium]